VSDVGSGGRYADQRWLRMITLAGLDQILAFDSQGAVAESARAPSVKSLPMGRGSQMERYGTSQVADTDNQEVRAGLQ
jgi:hypothetical protein